MSALLSGVAWATDRPVPLNVTGDLDSAGGCYGTDGPDACTCPAIPGEHTDADCWDWCSTCRGTGGRQQHDGLIVECPRGCMTREDNR